MQNPDKLPPPFCAPHPEDGKKFLVCPGSQMDTTKDRYQSASGVVDFLPEPPAYPSSPEEDALNAVATFESALHNINTNLAHIANLEREEKRLLGELSDLKNYAATLQQANRNTIVGVKTMLQHPHVANEYRRRCTEADILNAIRNTGV